MEAADLCQRSLVVNGVGVHPSCPLPSTQHFFKQVCCSGAEKYMFFKAPRGEPESHFYLARCIQSYAAHESSVQGSLETEYRVRVQAGAADGAGARAGAGAERRGPAPCVRLPPLQPRPQGPRTPAKACACPCTRRQSLFTTALRGRDGRKLICICFTAAAAQNALRHLWNPREGHALLKMPAEGSRSSRPTPSIANAKAALEADKLENSARPTANACTSTGDCLRQILCIIFHQHTCLHPDLTPWMPPLADPASGPVASPAGTGNEGDEGVMVELEDVEIEWGLPEAPQLAVPVPRPAGVPPFVAFALITHCIYLSPACQFRSDRSAMCAALSVRRRYWLDLQVTRFLAGRPQAEAAARREV